MEISPSSAFLWKSLLPWLNDGSIFGNISQSSSSHGSSTNLDTTVKLNKGESTQKFSQFIKKESWIFHLFFWGQITPGLVAPTHLGWFELYIRSPWSLLKLSNCYLGFLEKGFHRKPRCRIAQQQVSLVCSY